MAGIPIKEVRKKCFSGRLIQYLPFSYFAYGDLKTA